MVAFDAMNEVLDENTSGSPKKKSASRALRIIRRQERVRATTRASTVDSLLAYDVRISGTKRFRTTGLGKIDLLAAMGR